jgi:hypothetical protein
MRESCKSGSVGEAAGDPPLYPTGRVRAIPSSFAVFGREQRVRSVRFYPLVDRV